jgi:hypothetical protein
MQTIAEQVAKQVGSDNASILGVVLALCAERGATKIYEDPACAGRPVAHVFEDGSAIIVATARWGIRHPACAAFCWQNDGVCDCKATAAPSLLDALAMWVEDPVNCAVRTEPAPRAGCDCWACERTRIAVSAIAQASGSVVAHE